MFNVIATAASGMAAQSRRIEQAARDIATMGATQPAGGTQGASGSPVRIGALPVGDPIESVVTLVEAEHAYRLNAAVLATASDMLDAFLDTLDAE